MYGWYFLVKCCRLCLTFKKDLKKMSKDIINKATACVGDLKFNYNLPTLICNDCLETINLYFNFKNRCLQSEYMLNCYIEKLTESKLTNVFTSIDLNVTIDDISDLHIQNYSRDVKVCINGAVEITTPKLVKQADKFSLGNKSNKTFNLDEADYKFLEENSSKIIDSEKNELSVISPSTNLDSNKSCGMLTGAIKKRVLIRKFSLNPNPARGSTLTRKNLNNSTNVNNSGSYQQEHNPCSRVSNNMFEKTKEIANKSCIFSYDLPMPSSKSEITTNTDLENDIPFHCIGITKQTADDSSQDERNLSSVALESSKPIQIVLATKKYKSPIQNVIENNVLHKTNFTKIYQLNGCDSANVTSKQTVSLDNTGCTKPLFNIQYVPIIHPVKSKILQSYLKNNYTTPDYLKPLLKPNQQASRRRYPASCTSISSESAPKKLCTNGFQNTRITYNYTTNGSDSKTNNLSADHILKNTIKLNRGTGVPSTSANLDHKVIVNRTFDNTRPQYIMLKKITNVSLKNTDLRTKKAQQSVLKPTEYAENLATSEQVSDLTTEKKQKSILKTMKTTKNLAYSEQGALIVPKQETLVADFTDDNYKSISENHLETLIKEENCDISNYFVNNETISYSSFTN